MDIPFKNSYGSHDLHYDSENYGIEVVGELDGGGSYEFDLVTVWRHKESGEIRWGSDSGCSCPTPYESLTNWNELEKLPETISDFEKRVMDLGYSGNPSATDKVEFIQKIRAELKVKA